MKKTNKTLSAVVIIAGMMVAGFGCAKIDDFGTTNNNPGAATAPLTSALLTNTEARLARDITSGVQGAIYAQYISETQYTDVSLYSLPQFNMDGSYAGSAISENGITVNTASLQDLQVIINLNSNPATAAAAAAFGSNANQIGIATILKGYIYWKLTDLWGDIPYTEALQGAANASPAYDDQETVYFGVIKELKAIVNTFDVGATIKGDIIYSGDIAKWKKLANTIRMHMALRLTKRYPAAGGKAAVEFADAASGPGGIITSNADNFTLVPVGGAYVHTWYFNYIVNQRSDYAASKTLGDCLANLGDGRGAAYASNGNYFPYGLTRTLAEAFSGSVGNNYALVLADANRTATSPYVMLSAAATLLARAEAVQRGWMAGSAQADYEAGVRASYAQWNVSVPTSYLTTGNANFTSGAGAGPIGQNAAPYDAIPATQTANTPTPLERIQLQQWLANYPNGGDGWAQFRRTNVPALKPTRFAVNSGEGIPRRYTYGTRDYSLNPVQLAIAVGKLSGGDKPNSYFWWDKP